MNPRTRRLRRHRRTYAAAVRLAVACGHWVEVCRPRPLTVDAPAEDDAADREWDRTSDWHRTQVVRLTRGLDRRHALDTLRTSERARDASRKALIGNGLDADVPVHAFGPGWQRLGTVSL